MVERVPTGIAGLDELIEGGFPKGSVTLVTGGPGTGKTTICSQFLWKGLQEGEKCLYISTEEMVEEIKSDAEVYGFDFDQFDERFDMEYIVPSDSVPQNIQEMVIEGDYDRIVLDSLSVFGIYWDDLTEVRRRTNDLLKQFREDDATVVATAELTEDGSGKLSRYGIAEFITDGVLELNAKAMGSGLQRTLTLSKMRKTDIEGGIHDLKMSDNGMKVE